MLTKKEREERKDMGNLNRLWAVDLTSACRLLFAAGATEEEVDIILGSHVVPTNVDASWVNVKRSWYANRVEGK